MKLNFLVLFLLILAFQLRLFTGILLSLYFNILGSSRSEILEQEVPAQVKNNIENDFQFNETKNSKLNLTIS
jgi:hypothetical protein